MREDFISSRQWVALREELFGHTKENVVSYKVNCAFRLVDSEEWTFVPNAACFGTLFERLRQIGLGNVAEVAFNHHPTVMDERIPEAMRLKYFGSLPHDQLEQWWLDSCLEIGVWAITQDLTYKFDTGRYHYNDAGHEVWEPKIEEGTARYITTTVQENHTIKTLLANMTLLAYLYRSPRTVYLMAKLLEFRVGGAWNCFQMAHWLPIVNLRSWPVAEEATEEKAMNQVKGTLAETFFFPTMNFAHQFGPEESGVFPLIHLHYSQAVAAVGQNNTAFNDYPLNSVFFGLQGLEPHGLTAPPPTWTFEQFAAFCKEELDAAWKERKSTKKKLQPLQPMQILVDDAFGFDEEEEDEIAL